MSYTRFAYGPLRVRTQRDRTRPAQVSVTIANVGSRAGIDVPQLYLDNPSPGRQIPQPPRQLRGFERVALRPGARADVTFTVTARDLAWWDTGAQGWRVATGCYKLFVGSSSRDLPGSATIAIGAARCRHPAARVRPPSAASIAASLL
jgi:beta-glucosidase